jgi:hypothetical protein
MECIHFSGLDSDGYRGPGIWVRNYKLRTVIVTRETRAPASNIEHKKKPEVNNTTGWIFLANQKEII